MQTDQAVGELLKALDRLGLAEDTLVFLTSDSGCSPQAYVPAWLAAVHSSSPVFLCHNADIYEGCHRVPFIVRWPGRVVPVIFSDQPSRLTSILFPYTTLFRSTAS